MLIDKEMTKKITITAVTHTIIWEKQKDGLWESPDSERVLSHEEMEDEIRKSLASGRLVEKDR